MKCKVGKNCKNGFVREKQRYKCKKDGYNFTIGRKSKPIYLKKLMFQLYLEKLGFG